MAPSRRIRPLHREDARLDKPARAYRFVVLALAGTLTIGTYFAYDSIGAMVTTLMAARGLGQDDIGLLYSVYSIAAIVAVVPGGLLIDRIGTRRASLLFSTLVVAGAAIVALAPGLGTLAVGRVAFGLGSESLIVAQGAILARWFRGRELALAFGVALAMSRLGTLFSFNTEALLAVRFGPAVALWIAAGLCLASLLANVALNALDRHAERVPGLLEPPAAGRISLADVRRFGAPFWLVSLLCFTFYAAIFPFTALSTDFFAAKWGLPLSVSDASDGLLVGLATNFLHLFDTAPGTTSILVFSSLLLAPFAGGLVDRFGRRSALMLAGSLLMIPCFLLLAFTDVPPRYPMMLLGGAFVLVPAAMWPAVPLLVEPGRVGTAYGVITLFQNVGLAVFPWVNGRLRTATGGYEAGLVLFASLGLLGVGFAWMLARADRAGVLVKGSADRARV